MHAIVRGQFPSDIASAGTFTLPYPSGYAAKDFLSTGHKLAANQGVLTSGASTFSLAFGASSITFTSAYANTFNRGASFILQIAVGDADELTGDGVIALTDGATIDTDCSLGDGTFSVTLGGDRTLANPSNLIDGQIYVWIITQDDVGSRTLAYGSMFKWPAGAAPTLTTSAGAVDVISAVYRNGSLLAQAGQAFA